MGKITRVGVVRWDACGDLTTFFGASAYRTLRNPKYRGRLPFYTKFAGDGARAAFDFPTDSAEYADEETRLAASAGADYFMFCYYPNEPFYEVDYGKNVGLATIAPYLYQLNAGLDAYKDLPDKRGVKWCAIIGVSRLSESDYEKLAGEFGSDDYEKIDGRPLVYVFTRDEEEDYKARLTRAAKKRGFEPYFVAMYNASEADGFDAVGSYAVGGSPCENYAANYLGWWKEHHRKRLATGYPVIPAVAMGWDPRPRIDAPVVWYGYLEGEYEELSERNILDQAEEARKLLADNPAASIGHATFFAWDEFEEGGWICPTVTVDERGEPIRDEHGKVAINADKLRAFAAAVKVLKGE